MIFALPGLRNCRQNFISLQLCSVSADTAAGTAPNTCNGMAATDVTGRSAYYSKWDTVAEKEAAAAAEEAEKETLEAAK